MPHWSGSSFSKGFKRAGGWFLYLFVRINNLSSCILAYVPHAFSFSFRSKGSRWWRITENKDRLIRLKPENRFFGNPTIWINCLITKCQTINIIDKLSQCGHFRLCIVLEASIFVFPNLLECWIFGFVGPCQECPQTSTDWILKKIFPAFHSWKRKAFEVD